MFELPPSAQPARRDSRKETEDAVAIAATMLLAGSWAGRRYLGSSFFVVWMTVTLCIFVGTIAYAVVAKRLRVLLFPPLFLFAVVGQEILAVLFPCVGIIGARIAVAVAFIRSTRQNWILAAKMGLIGLAAFSSVLLWDRLRLLGAHRTAVRAEVLIEAIDRFRTRERNLPSSLDDLVPHDLPSIPDTGMAEFPSFHYAGPKSEADVDGERPFATYELRVNLYRLLNFDGLVY